MAILSSLLIVQPAMRYSMPYKSPYHLFGQKTYLVSSMLPLKMGKQLALVFTLVWDLEERWFPKVKNL